MEGLSAKRWLPALVVGGALVLAACADRATAPVGQAGLDLPSAALPLFFMPPLPGTAPVEGRLWVALRLGADLPGEPVGELRESFDYLAFRLGGEQWVVAPTRRDDEAGVWIDVGSRRGGSLLGFTTVPRTVRWGDGPSARLVRFQQHAKLCLSVRRGAYEEPEASPAVAARFGFALEINPVFDPLPLVPGDELSVRVRFGKGIAGVEVVADCLGGEGEVAREVFRGRTDAEGFVRMPMTRAGVWRLRAMHEVAGRGEELPEIHLATLVFRTGEL